MNIEMASPAENDVSTISPELVLVDPELARRLHERDRVRERQKPPLPVLGLPPETGEGSDDEAQASGAQALV